LYFMSVGKYEQILQFLPSPLDFNCKVKMKLCFTPDLQWV